jgi:hypothetical protein
VGDRCLSPDRVKSSNPTPGWDIYALGCVVLHLTAKLHFHGTIAISEPIELPLDPLVNPRLSGFVDMLADMMSEPHSNPICRGRGAETLVAGRSFGRCSNGVLGVHYPAMPLDPYRRCKDL